MIKEKYMKLLSLTILTVLSFFLLPSCNHCTYFTNHMMITPPSNYMWELRTPTSWELVDVKKDNDEPNQKYSPNFIKTDRVSFKYDKDTRIAFYLNIFASKEKLNSYLDLFSINLQKRFKEKNITMLKSAEVHIEEWKGVCFDFIDNDSNGIVKYYLFQQNDCLIFSFITDTTPLTSAMLNDYENVVRNMKIISPIVKFMPDGEKQVECSFASGQWQISVPSNSLAYYEPYNTYQFKIDDYYLTFTGVVKRNGNASRKDVEDTLSKNYKFTECMIGDWEGIKAEDDNLMVWGLYRDNYLVLAYANKKNLFTENEINQVEEILKTIKPITNKQ